MNAPSGSRRRGRSPGHLGEHRMLESSHVPSRSPVGDPMQVDRGRLSGLGLLVSERGREDVLPERRERSKQGVDQGGPPPGRRDVERRPILVGPGGPA